MSIKKKRLIVVCGGILLLIYIGSYLALSRRGYAEADLCSFKGFYYLTPEDTDRWRTANYGLAILYWPVNRLDRLFGTGRSPAAEPMWRLDR